MVHDLENSEADMMAPQVTVPAFTCEVTKTLEVLPLVIIVGTKPYNIVFFRVDSTATYRTLLERYWIHANACIPSSLH